MGWFCIIMRSFRWIMRYFRIIMGAFCKIVGVQGVQIGNIAIEASHLNIIRGANCITSAGHIIISVFNIPLCQFCIIACANYNETEPEPVYIMNHVLGTLGLFINLYQYMFFSSPLVLFTCVLLAKAGLVVGPLPPSVRPQHFMGAKFVQSVTPKVFIPFY